MEGPPPPQNTPQAADGRRQDCVTGVRFQPGKEAGGRRTLHKEVGAGGLDQRGGLLHLIHLARQG
jgi:hypothetical protein